LAKSTARINFVPKQTEVDDDSEKKTTRKNEQQIEKMEEELRDIKGVLSEVLSYMKNMNPQNPKENTQVKEALEYASEKKNLCLIQEDLGRRCSIQLSISHSRKGSEKLFGLERSDEKRLSRNPSTSRTLDKRIYDTGKRSESRFSRGNLKKEADAALINYSFVERTPHPEMPRLILPFQDARPSSNANTKRSYENPFSPPQEVEGGSPNSIRKSESPRLTDFKLKCVKDIFSKPLYKCNFLCSFLRHRYCY